MKMVGPDSRPIGTSRKPVGARRREQFLADQRRIQDAEAIGQLYGPNALRTVETPGEASRPWMRGWKAAVDACYGYLIVPLPPLPSSARDLDDRLERLGKLRPEAPTYEEERLERRVRVLEAELALERAQRRYAESVSTALGGV